MRTLLRTRIRRNHQSQVMTAILVPNLPHTKAELLLAAKTHPPLEKRHNLKTPKTKPQKWKTRGLMGSRTALMKTMKSNEYIFKIKSLNYIFNNVYYQ